MYVGALTGILNFVCLLLIIICKVLDSSRSKEQEPGISSVWARWGLP